MSQFLKTKKIFKDYIDRLTSSNLDESIEGQSDEPFERQSKDLCQNLIDKLKIDKPDD